MNDTTLIIARIVEQMKKRGISYRTLSAKTGIPKSALQRYISGETNKIPIDRIEAMAKCFGISAAYLMGWTDDEYYNPNADESTIMDTESNKISEEDIKIALFNGADNITDEMWNEVLNLVEYIKFRENNKRDNKS